MLTIIGCGNPYRCDDGAGIAVVRRLVADPRVTVLSEVKIFDAGTAGMDVMFQARGADTLILVDASDSGSEPGSIFRVPGDELERSPVPSYTLHDFRWEHALHAGRRIFRDAFPRDVTVYLIEREKLELGTELSPRISIAVDRVTSMLLERLGVEPAPPVSIRIKGGSFYLKKELYDRFFGGRHAVAVTRRDGQWAILPLLQEGAGGLLIKVLNARGDRVIHAREFLEQAPLDESLEYELPVRWNPDLCALTMVMPEGATLGR